MKFTPHGLGLVSTLLIFTLLAAFLAAVGLVLGTERARVRDAKRMADMVRVQYAFETLYRERASFAPAASGCPNVGDLVSTCALGDYWPQISSLKDPGRFAYRLAAVPNDTDYAVAFQLERAYGNLPAGRHVLTSEGIQ